MADQHVKGAVSTAEGTLEAGLGKVTGDRKLEAKGKAKQLQGKLQNSLGDAQDRILRVRQH